MNTFPTLLLIVAAYLIGAIPFGYVIGKYLKGIDVRTVGSGNIGATNVGRILGFRFFLLVFTLDMLKGLLPTWEFARLGAPAVPVALATILGHTFPVYLRFKGGKGVATSLGALLALDPRAAGASAFGFLLFVALTRYVSLSAIAGGMVFFLAHFARVAQPWSPEERAMSLLTIALLVLLIFRHRKNFARIARGTEPKVPFRRKPRPATGGFISAKGVVLLALLIAVIFGIGTTARRMATKETLRLGDFTLTEVARAATGHQRAERVAFSDDGGTLAVSCPRYERLVLYRVTGENTLEIARDVELGGQPVAVSARAGRFYVLLRPSGDRRHVERGWWQAFDDDGEADGERHSVGYYPDDLALTPDGRSILVLTSGRAEGSADRLAPALTVYSLAEGKELGHVAFDNPTDDPTRLTLSTSGRSAVVTLSQSNETAAVDLTDLKQPRLIGRQTLASVERPYRSRNTRDDDTIVMPATDGREALLINLGVAGDYVAATLPRDSGVEFLPPERGPRLGRLPLHAGTFGIGSARPTSLAFSPSRQLLAVSNRNGGVHLVAVHGVTRR